MQYLRLFNCQYNITCVVHYIYNFDSVVIKFLIKYEYDIKQCKCNASNKTPKEK